MCAVSTARSSERTGRTGRGRSPAGEGRRGAARPGADAAEEILRAGLIALAAVSFALALFMVLAPGTFFSAIGPFGRVNAHYIRDTATFYAAFGVGQALAVTRPSWRVPVLVMTAAQYLLHALNHLVDISAAHPAWIGYVDFVSLLLTGLAVLWLITLARAQERA